MGSVEMQAAVLHTFREPLVLDEVEVSLPSSREILVRTAVAGICHSDISAASGEITLSHSTPLILGHEAAGTVVAVGSDVAYVREGDHVVVGSRSAWFCGSCEFCLKGRPVLCHRRGMTRSEVDPHPLSIRGERIWQFGGVGSFAELMLVHENGVVKLRRDIPLDIGALMGCAVVTGLGAVLRTAQVARGSSVAVIGCGPVGLNCIQGASLAGAREIIAIDLISSKLSIAREFGATNVIDASQVDVVDHVLAMTDGIDYVFEAVGGARTVEQAVLMLRPGGIATIVGDVPAAELAAIKPMDLLEGERRIQGSRFGSTHFRLDVPHYLDLYSSGRLKLDELITSRISLGDINQVLYAHHPDQQITRVVVMT